jgi:hypothetical protein
MQRMRFRYLRLAFSVICVACCLGFSVLWVRSDPIWDSSWPTPRFEHGNFAVYSVRGSLRAIKTPFWIEESPNAPPRSYFVPSRYQNVPYNFNDANCYANALGFHFAWFGTSMWALQFPYWSAISAFAVCGFLPWIRWRFGLRSLMVGMSIVAAGLGILVISAKPS